MLRLRAALRTVRTMDGFRQCHRFVGPLLGGRSLSLQTRWFVLHGTECGMWALALLQLGFVATHYGFCVGNLCAFLFETCTDALGDAEWYRFMAVSQLLGRLCWGHFVGRRVVHCEHRHAGENDANVQDNRCSWH